MNKKVTLCALQHTRAIWIVFATMLLSAFRASADDQPASMSTDAIINLPLNGAWKLFTTPQGLKSMGYEPAQIELRLDGNLRFEQRAAGESIDARIVSFEPERMLSFKHMSAATGPTWSILYFQAMGIEMTSVRWVDFAPAGQTQNLAAAAQAHRVLFNQLIRRYAPECELCRKEREEREAKEAAGK